MRNGHPLRAATGRFIHLLEPSIVYSRLWNSISTLGVSASSKNYVICWLGHLNKKNMEKDEVSSKKMTKVKQPEKEEMGEKLPTTSPSELKISNWNINGLRAVNGRGDLKKYLMGQHIDILCLNETKIDIATLDKSNETVFIPKEYHQYWNCCKSKKGYSGTAILSRIKPLKVIHDLGIEKHDQEGRTITLEFDKFFLVCCYVPNAGQKLE
jgi:AP endonuclease-1